MASTAPTTSGSRSRVASPGARKETAAPAKAAPTPAADPKPAEEAKPAAEEEVGVFGFHPEVERAVIWIPLIMFVGMMLAAGPFQESFRWFGLHCMETWVFFTRPFEKLIVEQTSLLLALAAATSLAPLAIFVAVTALRAASEVEQNANSWQYAALVILIVAALASFIYTGQFSSALQQWYGITAPLEKVLVENADNVIAASAAIVLVPIALSMVVFVLKCMFGRKVSVTLDETSDSAAGAKADEKEVAQE